MRIAFFSTMGGLPWGGSEELWSRAASVLLANGHQVAFNCFEWPSVAPPLQQLVEAGASPTFRSRRRIGRTLRQTLEKLHLVRLKYMGWLQKCAPDFVVISFSCHTDEPQIALTCQALGIRYAIVLQAAGTSSWIDHRRLPDFRSAYAQAEQCYFVSRENRDTLCANLAIDLSQSEIVDNPFNVSLSAVPAWPVAAPYWKLACVARLHFATKAQDLLLQALRMPKWRERPLRLTLWGSDNGSLGQIKALIDLYNLHDQVSYCGFADDIALLWSQHHGLVLPSRMEGNALSLIEAMICGRVPITTNVGRAAELIDDERCGFIAPAATAELVDQVLERAWQRRNDWHAMGAEAARVIRERHSLRPAEDFAERILAVATYTSGRRSRAA
jgi:glycosyltransferase involved in cell wall biosynthesis